MLSLGQIHYDARRNTFEARVDIRKNGVTYRYPCRVEGPANMENSRVLLGLARHARRQSGLWQNQS
jgi:hypothetical protein